MFSRAGLSNCKVCINRAFFSSLSGKKLPYIEKAKLHGVQSLLGQFSTSGFYDDTLKNLNILKLDPNGDVLAKFQVDESQCNSYKTLHGGMFFFFFFVVILRYAFFILFYFLKIVLLVEFSNNSPHPYRAYRNVGRCNWYIVHNFRGCEQAWRFRWFKRHVFIG